MMNTLLLVNEAHAFVRQVCRDVGSIPGVIADIIYDYADINYIIRPLFSTKIEIQCQNVKCNNTTTDSDYLWCENCLRERYGPNKNGHKFNKRKYTREVERMSIERRNNHNVHAWVNFENIKHFSVHKLCRIVVVRGLRFNCIIGVLFQDCIYPLNKEEESYEWTNSSSLLFPREFRNQRKEIMHINNVVANLKVAGIRVHPDCISNWINYKIMY